MKIVDHTLILKYLPFTSKLYCSAKNEQTIPSVLYCQECPIKKMNVYSVID